MKKFQIMVFAIGALSYSTFAIMGIGAHFTPNLGSSLDASSVGTSVGNLKIETGKAENFLGAGVKLWVDAIPYVEIEGSFAVQIARYSASIFDSTNTSIRKDLSVDTKLPLIKKASPAAGMALGDFSVRYKIFNYPPALNVVRFSAGAGISYIVTPAILDGEFVKESLSSQYPSTTTPPTLEDAGKSIIDAYTKEELSSGIGFHVVGGVKIKPPVVPLAIYGDVKYHTGGNIPKQIQTGVSLELGAAIAF